MLTLILGTDWTANTDAVLKLLAEDVRKKQPRRILLVPELISHDTERRLCAYAGDSCSRYAEVVSFTRLTNRICNWTGYGPENCLDDGGRLIAMAAASRQLHSKIKAYAAMETKPEFLSALVDAVDEFKRCCITSEDLSNASKLTTGAFSQKLEELSLLLEAYDAVCQRGKRDPRDLLTWGLELLMDSDFAQSHVFYIDGFPDFTRQNMSVIAHLIEYAPQVVISLNCDMPGSKNLAFEKAGDTAARILKIARQAEVPYEIKIVKPREIPLFDACSHLFQGKLSAKPELHDRLHVLQADSVYDECVLAAERILELVHNGSRYRDISVVCPDIAAYGSALTLQLQMCGIPTYMAGTDDILEKSVISTVLTALDAALSGFESRDVLRYLKSALSPLDIETCDKIENYVLLWGIDGKKWLIPWSNHPRGLENNWSQEDTDLLNLLNEARASAMQPLENLACGFRNAVCLQQQVQALCHYLDEIQMASRLSSLAEEMDAIGDNRNAQILNQLWDILLNALEQLQDILGQTAWDNDTFTRLLKLLLSQYDVGTIPPVLDTVQIGPVSAMRCQQVRHLIIIGAAEGSFPKYGSVSGVLSDQERNALRHMGVPLTGGASEGLQIEFSEIYGVFCGASESVYVSCPTGQTSFVYRRLAAMTGQEHKPESTLGASGVNCDAAAAYLIRCNTPDSACKLGIESNYRALSSKISYELGKVTEENIRKLYGKKLNLSASQVDKQAECRLAYFLKYGLRAQERKAVSVDPAEFGTYVHAVLEQTARDICDLGGFKSVSLQQTLEIAKKYSDLYTREHFSQLDSQRITYLFQRNSHELMMVVEELWNELQSSDFQPVDFELAFGDGMTLPAIQIPGSEMPAQLRGFVDRVDSWQDGGRNYYRIVDYKTGRKDFDYCDVFNGLGLQMLLYLFTLEQTGHPQLGTHPKPAGVQYFPARVPILATDGVLDDEAAAQERLSQWKRKGLILNDDDVLFAMENSENPVRLSCRRKKDGTLTGDVASREQFKLLSRYVFHLLAKMVGEIASGNVDPNPYTRGNSHNACQFCPYGMICHSAVVEGRRNYKTMSAQRFWDDIEKEMSNHD